MNNEIVVDIYDKKVFNVSSLDVKTAQGPICIFPKHHRMIGKGSIEVGKEVYTGIFILENDKFTLFTL
jgi:hypothetical protein